MWLIVFGPGPESEALADLIALQCQQHRITVRKRAIDEYDPHELGRFPSLVACVPSLSSSTKVRQTLDPFAVLVKNYRARWYRGLSATRDGSVDILDVGVVQLFGETVALHNPALRSAHRTACHVQAVDADPIIDALRPYRAGFDPSTKATPWDDPVDVAGQIVVDTLRYLSEWGCIDTAKVPLLLACIESCRDHFENPRKPALYRPIAGTPSNRLDFILDGGEPHHTPQAGKSWHENGARVFRHVRDQLQRIVPDLARPGDPRAPHAQRDLRRLYESLKFVDTHTHST